MVIGEGDEFGVILSVAFCTEELVISASSTVGVGSADVGPNGIDLALAGFNIEEGTDGSEVFILLVPQDDFSFFIPFFAIFLFELANGYPKVLSKSFNVGAGEGNSGVRTAVSGALATVVEDFERLTHLRLYFSPSERVF